MNPVLVRRLALPAVAVLAIAGETLATHVDVARQPGILRALLLVILTTAPMVVVLLPGLAALALVGARCSTPWSRIVVLLVASGMAGMGVFWITYLSADIGRIVALAVLAASVVVLATPQAWDALVQADLVVPLGLAMSAVALYSGVAYLDGGLSSPTRAIFDHLWAVFDNRIPQLFAVRLADGRPVHGFVITDWHFSDRPPLQSAMLLPQYALFGRRDLGYQFSATALQTLWVLGAWAVLRTIGARLFTAAAAVAIVVPSGVLFFNSVYVWPKLLAATFVLAAVAVVFAPRCDREGRAHDVRIALVAAAALLAMLAHGSSVYALLALAPFAIVRLGVTRHLGRSLLVVVLAFAALYVPWSAFQKYEDPPGNRLAKWHLANVVDPTDKRSTLEAVTDQYSRAGLDGVLENKLDNLTTLVWRDDYARVAATWGWEGDRIGRFRITQLEILVPSLLPLLLVAFVLATRRGRRLARPLVPLAGWAAGALLVWCALQFGRLPASRTVVHNGSLAPVVAVLALCAVLAVRFDRRVGWAAAGAQVVVFGVVWVDGLRGKAANPHPTVLTGFDRSAAVLVLGGAIAIGAILVATHRSCRRSADVERQPTGL